MPPFWMPVAGLPFCRGRERAAAHAGSDRQNERLNIKLVLVEPFFDLKTPNAIARATGAEVLVLPPSVGGVKDASDYFALFDYNINLLITAIRTSAAQGRSAALPSRR